MKIGILTVYFADYGSYFHATSLYNYLKMQGHECELVHESLRYPVSKKLALSSFVSRFAPKFIKEIIGRRITPFKTYMLLKKDLEHYHLSPRCKHVKDIEDRYDCIIVGSDELWSCTNNTIQYIPDYFGLGITKPHFSYSTSGITIEFPNQMEEDIKRGLMTFSNISVRDSVTAQWVGRMTNRCIPIVLDPALLYPYYKKDRDNIKTRPYILVYGEDFSEDQIQWIRNYSMVRNCHLYSVAWQHDWCDSHLNLPAADDLQQAFARANHCMTSTFHGTIFSIVNHVPFTSFSSKNRGQKVISLLDMLNLNHCLYSSDSDWKQDMAIDYGQTDAILERYRIESESFLIDSLAAIEKQIAN